MSERQSAEELRDVLIDEGALLISLCDDVLAMDLKPGQREHVERMRASVQGNRNRLLDWKREEESR